jgi:hypothetical protein
LPEAGSLLSFQSKALKPIALNYLNIYNPYSPPN